MGMAPRPVLTEAEVSELHPSDQAMIRANCHRRWQLAPTPKPLTDPSKARFEIFNGAEFVAAIKGIDAAMWYCLESGQGFLTIREKVSGHSFYCFCGKFQNEAPEHQGGFEFFDAIDAYERDPETYRRMTSMAHERWQREDLYR
jgi:hypothetical protein